MPNSQNSKLWRFHPSKATPKVSRTHLSLSPPTNPNTKLTSTLIQHKIHPRPNPILQNHLQKPSFPQEPQPIKPQNPTLTTIIPNTPLKPPPHRSTSNQHHSSSKKQQKTSRNQKHQKHNEDREQIQSKEHLRDSSKLKTPQDPRA